MSHKKVGIVVLNWNSWQDTMNCVSSVQQLDYLNRSLYVVDNASEDDFEQRLRTWNPSLRIIQSGGNLGWAGGNNAGIRIARAEGCHHVYLLNSDATVRADTLSLPSRWHSVRTRRPSVRSSYRKAIRTGLNSAAALLIRAPACRARYTAPWMRWIAAPGPCGSQPSRVVRCC